MSGTQHTGKAGHLAVMGEFCYRGYNAALPEIDKGDDIFVVNDSTGNMWRLQVKTAVGKKQKKSTMYQYRVKEKNIHQAQSPELHFVFVMRLADGWAYLIIDRAVLKNYVIQNNLGTLAGDYRQITITLHDDGRATCSKLELKNHLGDWNTWPNL